MQSPPLASSAASPSSEPAARMGDRLSTASLTLGLLGALLFAVPFVLGLRYGAQPPAWFFLIFPLMPIATPWLPALLAIVCGALGRRRLAGLGEAASGARLRALCGIIFGALLLTINLIVAAFALIVYLVLK